MKKVVNLIRHTELEPFQSSLQAKKSCSGHQWMMNASLGPSSRRLLCGKVISLRPKAKGTAELGNMWPIHFNFLPAHQQQNHHWKQCIWGPSLPKSHIPRPSNSIASLPRPSILARPLLPHQLSKLPLQIPCLIHTSKADTACPSEEDLLHLSSINPLPSASVQPPETQDTFSTLLSIDPTCQARGGVGSWEPWLSRQPGKYCLILTVPKAVHKLQGDSLKPLTGETTG